MKTLPRHSATARIRAYLMLEVLVYISVLFVILGFGYVAVHRCFNHSLALRYAADDIESVLRAGERWREDVRAVDGRIELQRENDEQILRLPRSENPLAYRFDAHSVWRRAGDGPWQMMLDNVKSSTIEMDVRQEVTAVRWELELQARSKRTTRMRPLFTFIAVPAANQTP